MSPARRFSDESQPSAPAASLVVNPRASAPFDVILGTADDAQASLPLASDGVRRWTWQSRYGPMLIEVIGDDVFVNGQRVVPHSA